MSVTEKIISGLAAFCLFLLALQSLFIVMSAASALTSGEIAAIAVIGLGVLTTAVCFVTSYRQILRPRPVLVWSCLGLQVIFTTLVFALAYALFQDEELSAVYNALRDAFLDENDKTPPGFDVDDLFPSVDEMLSVSALLQSYLIIAALMAIPIVRSILYPRLISRSYRAA